MADHLRKQIRDAVKDGLTGLATTGARVFVGRTRALPADHAPTLLIYTREETSRPDANGLPPPIERTLQLFIEGRVSTPDPPDDDLDRIAAEIEAGMSALVQWTPPLKFLGGLVRRVRYNGSITVVEGGEDGARHLGGIRLEYTVTYRTLEGDPTAAI